ncbi:MAG TPA: hypothetical protein VKZ53_27140 [Candidatus Angelobacter sp.]|nr:hypothetical protein [Candidatus Angelobacter sp.]
MKLRKPKIARHDVIADDCPKRLKAHLALIGGYNIYDEPAFRLVRAEKCVMRISIERPFFADDQDPANAIPMKEVAELIASGVPEREALAEGARISERNLRPLRTEVGETLFPKYPFRGIVIERWQPPGFYGTRAEWESIHVARFPFLGAYPQYGDYSMIGSKEGIDWPSLAFVTEVIRSYREMQKQQPENCYTRFLIRAHAIQKMAEKKERALEQFYHEHLTDEWTGRCGLLHRVSLAAGRYRDEVAKRAGITEHAGN